LDNDFHVVDFIFILVGFVWPQTSTQSRKDIASSDQSKVIAELKAKLASAEAKDRDFGGCLRFA
jgi:hypothetical protein